MEGGGGGGISSLSTTTENSSNYAYRECLRNHAASLGSYATDGCGEFTVEDDGGSLQCAACGCHRNFHRKVVTAAAAASYPAHARGGEEYSGGGGGEGMMMMRSNSSNKKRFRTKFTAEQKEKMMGFAEKLGWKLQRKELDEEIERFCESVGISRQVFKVWMHNHKNSSSSFSSGNASSLTQ